LKFVNTSVLPIILSLCVKLACRYDSKNLSPIEKQLK
jgi:hypothetical protein